MKIARSLPELRAACQAARATHPSLALVPTMGALHAGHRALVEAAVSGGAAVVTSIFVNPTQFSPTEDLSRYPRDEAGDLATLRDSGCAIVWMPDVATMYPAGGATTINLTGPAENWEGTARPGHFAGVATVCTKLFGQVRADRAYFGEKDWQQLQVVTRMVSDLHLPLEIVPVATIRESDGLALSSRNRFLTAGERAQAPALYRELSAAKAALAAGGDGAAATRVARERLTAAGFAVDYLALVDGPSLTEIARPTAGSRLIAAARLGTVRLLDNIAAV
jgi:pantoate--beta-alanine ligase